VRDLLLFFLLLIRGLMALQVGTARSFLGNTTRTKGSVSKNECISNIRLEKCRQAFATSTHGPATFESASRAEDLVGTLLGPAEPIIWSSSLIWGSILLPREYFEIYSVVCRCSSCPMSTSALEPAVIAYLSSFLAKRRAHDKSRLDWMLLARYDTNTVMGVM